MGAELTPTLEELIIVTTGPVGAVMEPAPTSEGAGVLPAATELEREGVEVRVTVNTELDVVANIDDTEVMVAITGLLVSVT